MRIFIDPGHGGEDPGVVNGPLVEKDLNLACARIVRDRLVAAGHDVSLSRDADEALKLSERGALSKQADAELVLSIHTNANDNPGPRGLMTFHWPGNIGGQRVAEAVAKMCPEPLRRKQIVYAATKEAWPRVRNVLTVHTATAVLVEMGFSSNPHDRALLLDPKIVTAVADAIAWGAVVGGREITPAPKAASPAQASSPSISEPEAPATPAEPEAPPEEPSKRRRFPRRS